LAAIDKNRDNAATRVPVADLLAMIETSQKFQRVEYMISVSGTGTCGEEDFRCR